MTNNPFETSFFVHYTWNFTIKNGINWINLPQPVTVDRGSFLAMTQITGKVAIDITGNTTYSDLVWNTTTQWTALAEFYNWNFYLTPLTNFSSYWTSFNIAHTYYKVGTYKVAILFTSSNQTFTYTITIQSDSNYLLIFNNKTTLN